MKKIIRTNVFETNSSSSHAICICIEDKLDIPETLYFGIGEHGWEFERLDDVEDRSNYLYTGILHFYGHDEYEEKINWIKDVLEEQGCEAEFEEPKWKCYEDDYYLENGQVDHIDCLQEFLEKILNDEALLLDYLFSNRSYVQKGNDNSDTSVDIHVDYNHEEFYKGN